MRGDHLAIFGALLAIACASDVAERRIPNALVAAFAVGGAAAQWLTGGAAAAAGGAVAGAAVFALLFLAWATGKLGGGDLKLAAATAVWLGPSRVVGFVLFAGMAGLPVALGARLAHRLELQRLVRAAAREGQLATALPVPRETVPLAVAITLGAFAALQWRVP